MKNTKLIENLFYIQDIRGSVAYLREEELKHCCLVLRKRKGDELAFVDGLGNYYEGVLEEVHKTEAKIHIIQTIQEFETRPYAVHLAISPTKNAERLEWCVEKATEIGVDDITLLHSHRTVRSHLRLDRLERVAISAMKQCQKAKRPIIHELIDFKQFIYKNHTAQKFIAHLEGEHTQHLKDVCQPQQDALILIGPEGDFTTEEINLAKTNGFTSVSLGNSRLRTETAGVVAVNIINLNNF